MKQYLIRYILLVPLLFACGPQSDTSDSRYRLLHDDLYIDNNGNIYHRTVDTSAGGNKEEGVVYSYRDYCRLDTLISGERIALDTLLRTIVDTATFHKTPTPEGFEGYLFYEDAHFNYSMKQVADGGTLSATRK